MIETSWLRLTKQLQGQRFNAIEQRKHTYETALQFERDRYNATRGQSAVLRDGFENVNTHFHTRSNDSNLDKIRTHNNNKDDFYVIFNDQVKKSQWSDQRAKLNY